MRLHLILLTIALFSASILAQSVAPANNSTSEASPTAPPSTKVSTEAPTTKAPTASPTSPSTAAPTTEAPTSPTTTEVPTTRKSTEVPTSKPTEPPTSSTEVPTTSTETTTITKVPTTSTKVPTTTSTEVPTTTSTEVPTTTSTEVPTTSTEVPTTSSPVPPTPKPTPAPKYAEFNVTDGKVTCLRVKLNITFSIPYNTSENTVEVHSLVPKSLTKTKVSTCEGTKGTQVLQLSLDHSPQNLLTLTFNRTEDNSTVAVSSLVLQYTPNYNQSVDPKDVLEVRTNGSQFQVKGGKAYLCNSNTTLKLEPAGPPSTLEHEVKAHLSDFSYKAYNDKKDASLANPYECEADYVMADIVPIAVGVALGALVVIVVVAYMVSRRRSKQKGYHSV